MQSIRILVTHNPSIIPLLVGIAIGSISLAAFQQINRVISRRNLSKPEKTLTKTPSILVKSLKKIPQPSSEHITNEQLSRNYAFLGQDGMEKVTSSFVIIIGLGGVGSHAAHMLLRSGVKKLRVIDFDQVSLSSLNRHAVATRADVGKSKSLVLKQHFAKICPEAYVDARIELFNGDNAHELLDGSPDYVLDCIDNVTTKIDLLKYCVKSNIRVISSMGSGAKADPSKICIADISETFEDPLARATRRGLKKAGILTGVEVIYSIEKPSVGLVPLDESKAMEATEFAPLPDFRVRILPVLGCLPALFGNALAARVITQIAGFKTEPFAVKSRKSMYVKIFSEIREAVKDLGQVLHISQSDVAFIVEEVWNGRSILSGDFTVTLVPWKEKLGYEMGNLVCMTKREADAHTKYGECDLVQVYGQDLCDFVEARFECERGWSRHRTRNAF